MDRKIRRAGKATSKTQAKMSPFLVQAMQLHQAGQLAQAEAAYRTALAQNDKNADALYLLGVLCAQKGAFADAEQLLKQTTGLRPLFPDAWYNLATLYLQTTRQAEAEAALKACLKQQPQHVGALWNLGSLYYEIGKPLEAEPLFTRYVKLRPDHFEARLALATIFSKQHRYGDAATEAQAALKIRNDPTANALLGHALYMLNDLDAAEAHLQRAIEDFPDQVVYRTLMATLLSRIGDFSNSAKLFESLLREFPNDPYVLFNHGTMLVHMGQADKGLEQVELANALKPNDPGILTSRGMIFLQMGRLEEGWRDFRFRFDSNQRDARRQNFKFPAFDDKDQLADHSILLWPEQGVGDQITYASAISDVIKDTREVEILSVPKLATLFKRSFPNARIITDPGRSRASRHMPLGELFSRYRPSLSAFLGRGAYLTPDPSAVMQFKKRLELLGPGLKVGIGWRSTSVNRERLRHFFPSLLPWAPILKVPGVIFINCQPNIAPHELDEARQAFGCRIENFADVDLFDDLDASAALSAALDLLICNGSAGAFLAAAVDTPVWMFYASDAHWDRLGTMSIPWLPSLIPVERLWNEGWDLAVGRIAEALGESARLGHLVNPASASPLRTHS
ncbi:MAG: tetratricopeptide repeat protein [Alphaproteobacteria bacterium]|nr:tetratricopeptide repeat protein [Alphaproteobacteria bacterium]